MNIIIPLLYIITILSAILLVGVVLLQKGKDGGMVAMGGGMGEALFGAQVGNFLVRSTIVLGSVFLLSVLVISVLKNKYDPGDSQMQSSSESAIPTSEDN